MRPAWATVALAALVGFGLPASAEASRVLVMSRDGHVRAVDDPFVPARADLPGAAAQRDRTRMPRVASAAAASKIPGALSALYGAGQIQLDAYDQAKETYAHARKLLHKVTGFRKVQMAGVLGDLEAMATQGRFTAARLPALMETLERNVEWWSKGSLLAPGARVSFTGSDIVWQHYANHGIQIQWLATFGKANALFKDKLHDSEYQALLDETLALAGPRAGGIAFEYLFPFDGGRPPWVSGMAQATALTALSRAAVRLADNDYFGDARSALGIFKTPPPTGVAEAQAAGTHYLQYSFAPKLHILNAFVQSLNGLHDFAVYANDDEGWQLFNAGESELRAELPAYDTGGWSRYSQGIDSSLSYHELLAGFLHALCIRMNHHAENGQLYCDASERFDADLTTPPKLTLATPTHRPRLHHLAPLSFHIDKPALVSVRLHKTGFTKWITERVSSGAHTFIWRPPHSGTYSVRVGARDLAGNSALIDGTAQVRR